MRRRARLNMAEHAQRADASLRICIGVLLYYVRVVPHLTPEGRSAGGRGTTAGTGTTEARLARPVVPVSLRYRGKENE